MCLLRTNRWLNPRAVYSSSVLPYPLRAGTNFTLNYAHSLQATDLLWQVQWSPDLLNWLTNDVTDSGVSTNGNIEVRQGSVPASDADPLFMRVQVTTP
jgi:hypothetical protein